jgi:hypothetical protein
MSMFERVEGPNPEVTVSIYGIVGKYGSDTPEKYSPTAPENYRFSR